MARALAAALAAFAALAGCQRHIGDTSIPDTADTRAIVGVIDAYRLATERRDADAVLALVSKDYFDTAGTPDPADDLDRTLLARHLKEDFARLPAARLEMSVRRIEVDGDRAWAELFYDSYYRIAMPRGEVPRQDQDAFRMEFRKEGGAWKIVSGL